ncbi:hypothetical protein MFIFM68171_09763 [Madurella fahalii]|uniref:Globin family profile domain-containing protein n=1 Tax=Madurella fahalii TaxID=1157608 RepID=A0ABQ0GP86_9PEZI
MAADRRTPKLPAAGGNTASANPLNHPGAPPPPSFQLPTRLSPRANATLRITLGQSSRTLLVEPALLNDFACWRQSRHLSPDETAIPILQRLSAEQREQHLDALQSLLAVLHAPQELGGKGFSVDDIWRLGTMHAQLGVSERWVEWLKVCMGTFVDECRARGDVGDVERGRLWEKALSACRVFGWVDEYRFFAARLAYCCRIEEEDGLVKADGEKVDVGIVGKGSVEIIKTARQTVLSNIVVATADLLDTWARLCRHQPCENNSCNSSSVAALQQFSLRSGLHPDGKLGDISLHDVITALKIITAPDAVADDSDKDRFVWATEIRETHGGACMQCDRDGATSLLFPLECLLSDITWKLQDKLYAATNYPHE